MIANDPFTVVTFKVFVTDTPINNLLNLFLIFCNELSFLDFMTMAVQEANKQIELPIENKFNSSSELDYGSHICDL